MLRLGNHLAFDDPVSLLDLWLGNNARALLQRVDELFRDVSGYRGML